MRERLLATLISFMDGYNVHRALGPVDAERARGFHADLIILSRQPEADESDQNDLIAFTECLSHSTIRKLVISEAA